jgi:hypothetical protein
VEQPVSDLELADLARTHGGPSVLRMLVGAQLRRLREARGIAIEVAGREIRASAVAMRRLERGQLTFHEQDIDRLINLYRVAGTSIGNALQSLVRQASMPGCWHVYSDVLPEWFEPYLALELKAQRIRTYEICFIPALLQTEAYARAAIGRRHQDASAEEVERRVSLRMRRQEMLTGADPPLLWAVVDEAALRCTIGGVDVMRGQLQHLIEAATWPQVELQVLTFRGSPMDVSPFSLLRFREPGLPDIAYLEQLTSALYIEKQEEVEQYSGAMEYLCIQAESTSQTRKIISEIRRDL